MSRTHKKTPTLSKADQLLTACLREAKATGRRVGDLLRAHGLVEQAQLLDEAYPATSSPVAEDIESVYRRASTNVALLVRWMEAEQYVERGGTNIELEHDAWYAAEGLLRQTRKDLQRLGDSGDEQGGAR